MGSSIQVQLMRSHQFDTSLAQAFDVASAMIAFLGNLSWLFSCLDLLVIPVGGFYVR
jgi:hypothetical protein